MTFYVLSSILFGGGGGGGWRSHIMGRFSQTEIGKLDKSTQTASTRHAASACCIHNKLHVP
jgi:hypothetical protein